MDHKTLHTSHQSMAAYQTDVASKMLELERLMSVVSQTNAPKGATGQELMLLTKLKNMLNILSLHTSSILNDLDALKITDGAYRETAHATEVSEIIDRVTNLLRPHSEMLYANAVQTIKNVYQQELNAAHHADNSNDRDSEISALNNPFYRNLNRH